MGQFSNAHFASNHFRARHWQPEAEVVAPVVVSGVVQQPLPAGGSGGGGDGVIAYVREPDRTASTLPGRFQLALSMSVAADALEAVAVPQEAPDDVLEPVEAYAPAPEPVQPVPAHETLSATPQQFTASFGLTAYADVLEPEAVVVAATFAATISARATATFVAEEVVDTTANYASCIEISMSASTKDVLRFAVAATDMFTKSEDDDFTVVSDDDFDTD